jgi:outer membrane protein OmpA-like peptidoglycan-associated protein
MRLAQLSKRLLVAHCGAMLLISHAYSQNLPAELKKVPTALPIAFVNYSPGRTASVGFVGTDRLTAAKGSAKVKMERSTAQIQATFQNLAPPPNFGTEYTSYVLWAITSDGKASNLGEIVMSGQKGQIKTAVPFQAFAMMVTAEPYFAIAAPSSIVVMTNARSTGITGTISTLTAKIDLVEPGAYAAAGLDPFVWESRAPRDLFQARNAVRIAEWQGAGRYAAELLQKAQQTLRQAELAEQQRRSNRNAIIQASRQAVQLAESARVAAVRSVDEERLARERAQAAEREAAAEASRRAAAQEAERQAQLRADAEAARLLAAEEAQRQVELRTAAEASRADAEASRLLAAQEAERARTATEEARQTLAQAQAEMRKLEAEKQELRSRLLKQFNMILETRDTARGLILNMGDVLFDVAKSDLRPEAREKLARLSGVLLGHPGLSMEIEGHTDSTGSDEFNQSLSEQRAGSVRTYLLSQGLAAEAAVARGLGETTPIASNDTSEGRQQNRRVEIIVSGEELGDPLAGMQ